MNNNIKEIILIDDFIEYNKKELGYFKLSGGKQNWDLVFILVADFLITAYLIFKYQKEYFWIISCIGFSFLVLVWIVVRRLNKRQNEHIKKLLLEEIKDPDILEPDDFKLDHLEFLRLIKLTRPLHKRKVQKEDLKYFESFLEKNIHPIQIKLIPTTIIVAIVSSLLTWGVKNLPKEFLTNLPWKEIIVFGTLFSFFGFIFIQIYKDHLKSKIYERRRLIRLIGQCIVNYDILFPKEAQYKNDQMPNKLIIDSKNELSLDQSS